jgi:hypothetical protein
VSPSATAAPNDSAGGDKDKRGDDADSTSATAAAAAPIVASATAAAQPVAAPIVANAATGVTPAPGNSSSDTTVGATARGHARLSPLAGTDARSGTAVDKHAASAGTTAQANKADAGATDQAGSSDSSVTDATGTDDSASQQPAASTDAAAPATPTADFVQMLSRPTLGAATAPGTPAASGASSGVGEAKAELAGLPNFGFVAAGITASSATAAATASTSAAAAVPIAGLAVAIAAHAQGGVNQFDIRLDPPELGRIDVRLGIDRDGQVTSHVTVDRPDTLQLLQSQQPQLERALEQAGLKTADNGLQFTLRDQSFTGQNGGGGNAPNYAPTLVVPDNELAAVPARPIYNRFGLGTGVDIRV